MKIPKTIRTYIHTRIPIFKNRKRAFEQKNEKQNFSSCLKPFSIVLEIIVKIEHQAIKHAKKKKKLLKKYSFGRSNQHYEKNHINIIIKFLKTLTTHQNIKSITNYRTKSHAAKQKKKKSDPN